MPHETGGCPCYRHRRAQLARLALKTHAVRSGLIGAGFLALLVGWLLTTPLTAGPDEPSHYYKALGAAYGQGSPVAAAEPAPGMTEHDRVLATLSGTFQLPPGAALQPGGPGQGIECVSFAEAFAEPADCQYRPPPPSATGPVPLPGEWDGQAPLVPPPSSGVFGSYVAPYPPFAYYPLGWVARLAVDNRADGADALRWARLVGAGLCALLLYGAARCSRAPAAAVGLLAAVTPTALFLGATVNTSGLEIAGAVCTGAAVLALVRGETRRETWLWLAVGGVVLATCRVFGPFYLAGYAGLLAALLGPRRLLELVRARPLAAASVTGGVGLAAAACLVWLLQRTPSLGGEPAAISRLVGPAVDNLPNLLDSALGRFGWTLILMPEGFYALGRWLLGGLLVLALLVGGWRQRMVLAAAVVATAAATVAVEVVTQAPFGYASQARYTMAVGVAVPLLCGHVIAERTGRLPGWLRRGLLAPALAAAALAVAVLHIGGWFSAARAWAIGRLAPPPFLADLAEVGLWAPDAGWPAVLRWALAGVGVLALAGLWAAAGVSVRASTRPAAGTALPAPDHEDRVSLERR